MQTKREDTLRYPPNDNLLQTFFYFMPISSKTSIVIRSASS